MIEDYCAEARRNLDSFTDEQWRELLRTIIENIVFTCMGIQIRGRIPVPGSEDRRAGDVELDVSLDGLRP